MTDIQQWRRRIQPARVRTPAIDLDDSEADNSPLVPGKSLKPKFTSQRPYHAEDYYAIKQADNECAVRETPSWIIVDPTASPSVGELIDSLMCNLLGEPLNGLTGRFANDLMRVFEDHRALKDQVDSLQVRLDQEREKTRTAQLAWEREKQDYRAEVKRLELILSEGKRGLAEVTLARQDSSLRRSQQARMADESGLETILEQLEKSKRQDHKTWSSQRGTNLILVVTTKTHVAAATMKRRSPSLKMRRLSKALTGKPSKTYVSPDLPSGTLLSTSVSFLHVLDNKPGRVAKQTQSESMTSISDDDASSSTGDLLPDEIADEVYGCAVGADAQKCNSVQRPGSAATMRKPLTLKMKASGFLSRFRPQLTLDTSAGRRFSFEAGDDSNASLNAPAVNNLPPGVRSRLLRKSASMSTLEAMPSQIATDGQPSSRIGQRPTITTHVETQHSRNICDDPSKRSRIPTPVHLGSLARPRRERDDSSSSLLTAIRQSDRASHRSNSLSSSAFSSPAGSRIDLTQGWQGLDIVQVSTTRTSGSNRLVNRSDALRDNGLATVAQAEERSEAMLSGDLHAADGLEPGAGDTHCNYNRVAVQIDRDPTGGQIRKENNHPMRRHKRVNREICATGYPAEAP